MTALRLTLEWVLGLYLLLVILRLVLEWVQVLSPGFRPSGTTVVVFESVYTVTDPPLRLLRRFLPPLRFGSVSLDLSIMILIIVLYILRDQAARL